MNVTQVEYRLQQGFPVVDFLADGQPARLGVMGQKMNLVEELGAVFLGSAFEELTSVELPIGHGRTQPQKLYGYTADPNVMAVWRQFMADVESGAFWDRIERGAR
jgi:hypothetical protein